MNQGIADLSKGTTMAIGVVALWLAGLCFFVAFMSGKAASLIEGTTKNAAGTTVGVGPSDATELVSRIATNVQTLETPPAGSSSTQQPATEIA